MRGANGDSMTSEYRDIATQQLHEHPIHEDRLPEGSLAGLLARAQRMEIAARAAGLGIFEWDLDRGVAVDENARMHEILGHAGTVPLGPDGVRARLHRDDMPGFTETLRQAAERGEPWRLRVRAWRDRDHLVMAEFSGHVSAEAGRRRTIGALVDVGGAEPARPVPAAAAVARPFRGGLSPEQFARVCDYMARHLHEDVTLAQLSRLAGFSPFHFQRAFKRQTGTTPQGYLLRLRVQHAKNLLFATGRPLAEIAHAVGYGTAQAFARAFQRAESVTPAEFRRRMRD